MSSLRAVAEGTGLGEVRPPKQIRTMTAVNKSAMEPRTAQEELRSRRIGWPKLRVLWP